MDKSNQPKRKKSFYDLLWTLCEEEGLLEKWISDNLLGKSRDTYYWTAKAQNKYNYNIIGERKGDLVVDKPTRTSLAQKAKEKEEKFKETVTNNQLEEFTSLFSKKNLGISGKTTTSITVVKKLIKFFEDFPMYNMDDVIKATKLCIEDHKKNGSLKFMRECGYFIYKKIDGIEQSDLAKWCEELKSGGQSYTSHTIL